MKANEKKEGRRAAADPKEQDARFYTRSDRLAASNAPDPPRPFKVESDQRISVQVQLLDSRRYRVLRRAVLSGYSAGPLRILQFILDHVDETMSWESPPPGAEGPEPEQATISRALNLSPRAVGLAFRDLQRDQLIRVEAPGGAKKITAHEFAQVEGAQNFAPPSHEPAEFLRKLPIPDPAQKLALGPNNVVPVVVDNMGKRVDVLLSLGAQPIGKFNASEVAQRCTMWDIVVACDLALHSRTHVDNPPGYIVRAIIEKWRARRGIGQGELWVTNTIAAFQKQFPRSGADAAPLGSLLQGAHGTRDPSGSRRREREALTIEDEKARQLRELSMREALEKSNADFAAKHAQRSSAAPPAG